MHTRDEKDNYIQPVSKERAGALQAALADHQKRELIANSLTTQRAILKSLQEAKETKEAKAANEQKSHEFKVEAETDSDEEYGAELDVESVETVPASQQKPKSWDVVAGELFEKDFATKHTSLDGYFQSKQPYEKYHIVPYYLKRHEIEFKTVCGHYLMAMIKEESSLYAIIYFNLRRLDSLTGYDSYEANCDEYHNEWQSQRFLILDLRPMLRVFELLSFAPLPDSSEQFVTLSKRNLILWQKNDSEDSNSDFKVVKEIPLPKPLDFTPGNCQIHFPNKTQAIIVTPSNILLTNLISGKVNMMPSPHPGIINTALINGCLAFIQNQKGKLYIYRIHFNDEPFLSAKPDVTFKIKNIHSIWVWPGSKLIAIGQLDPSTNKMFVSIYKVENDFKFHQIKAIPYPVRKCRIILGEFVFTYAAVQQVVHRGNYVYPEQHYIYKYNPKTGEITKIYDSPGYTTDYIFHLLELKQTMAAVIVHKYNPERLSEWLLTGGGFDFVSIFNQQEKLSEYWNELNNIMNVPPTVLSLVKRYVGFFEVDIRKNHYSAPIAITTQQSHEEIIKKLEAWIQTYQDKKSNSPKIKAIQAGLKDLLELFKDKDFNYKSNYTDCINHVKEKNATLKKFLDKWCHFDSENRQLAQFLNGLPALDVPKITYKPG